MLVSVCLSAGLYVHLSICVAVHLSVLQAFRQFVHLAGVCLYVRLYVLVVVHQPPTVCRTVDCCSLCLSFYLSLCMLVICLSDLSVYLSVCLQAEPSVPFPVSGESSIPLSIPQTNGGV